MNTSLSIGKVMIFLMAAVVLFLSILAGISASVIRENCVIYGVMAENAGMEGMSRQEAEHFFEEAGRLRLKHQEIRLTYENRSWIIRPEEIRLKANAGEAADEALAVGRSGGSLLQNLLAQIKCARDKVYIDLSASYDEAMLQARLDDIRAAIDTEPVDAYCILAEDGSIQRIAGVVGKKLDTDALKKELAPALAELKCPHLELKPAEQQPAVRTEDIIATDAVLASYTTDFYRGARGNNIILAADSLDDVLVRSGETFSFNDTVGSRTYDAGYQNAGVIIEGRMEDGVGGGVCQVSSTLYNAILLAGLTPTVREPHFYPSAYCPPGMDATVADGVVDFQFRNPLPHNVYLLSRAYDNYLTIYVLGTQSDLGGQTITLEREGSDLKPSVYRVYRQGGQVLQREYLHTDSYSDPAEANPGGAA